MQYLKEIKILHISVVHWSPFVPLLTPCFVCKKMLFWLWHWTWIWKFSCEILPSQKPTAKKFAFIFYFKPWYWLSVWPWCEGLTSRIYADNLQLVLQNRNVSWVCGKVLYKQIIHLAVHAFLLLCGRILEDVLGPSCFVRIDSLSKQDASSPQLKSCLEPLPHSCTPHIVYIVYNLGWVILWRGVEY